MEAADESQKREELRAAEDLRRQLQERSAEGYELKSREDRLRWVDENSHLLTHFGHESWGAHDPGLTFTDFKRELENTPLPTPHDDPLTQSVVRMLCEEVENACQVLGIPLGSGVAYGSTPVLEISAERYAVPLTDASVISLSSGFITFCSHVSKVFSLSLPHEADGDRLKVSFEPKLVIARIGSSDELKRYWSRMIGAYAFGSGPLDIEQQLVPYPASITRVQLLLAMERFSVAHEYAHHIAHHGKREIIGSGSTDPEAINEELEADLFALSLDRHIGYREAPPNLSSASGAAAVLLLKCLECVKGVRQIFLTGDDTIQSRATHPEISDRIAAFNRLDEQVPDRNRQDFRKMREDFGTIVDAVYSKLKPIYIEMHQQGLRPLASANESWLPD
jgi:hypothetical protein